LAASSEGRLNITREPQVHPAAGSAGAVGGATATAEVVRLSEEVERAGVSIDDQIKQRDADLRDWMAKVIIPAFVKANGWTLAVIGALVLLDEANIVFRGMAPADRIIGSQVIMALLGATTVQVGAIAAIIARYLFPGRSA
jgi:hypothetical protein